jgi:hypothetical protein
MSPLDMGAFFFRCELKCVIMKVYGGALDYNVWCNL